MANVSPGRSSRIDPKQIVIGALSASAGRTGERDAASIITVVRDLHCALGKRFTRNPDGTVSKKSSVNLSFGIAVMHRVDTHDELAALLEKVGDDPDAAIINASFNGIEPGEEFIILSEREIEKRLGIPRADRERQKNIHTVSHNGKTYKAMGRFKENVRPSCWQYFDRDIDKHTPEQFAKLSDEEWMSELCEMVPGLRDVSFAKAASTSSRVLRDGVAVGGSNGHAWIKVNNPDDVGRFRVAMLVRAAQSGRTWLKPRYSRTEPGNIVGHSLTTIVDPSVWTPGRLVFIGKPLASDGLTIEPMSVIVQIGRNDALDTSTVTLPDAPTIREITRKAGAEMEVNAGGNSLKVTMRDLTLATALETEDQGTLTVRDILGRGNTGKIRCQTPFRDSASFAAFYSTGADGKPFVFDIGTGVTHWLTDQDAKSLAPPVPLTTLAAMQLQFSLVNMEGRLWVLDQRVLAARTGQGTAKKLVLSNRSDGALLIKRAVKKQFPHDNAAGIVSEFFDSAETVCYDGVEFNPAGVSPNYLNLWIGPTLIPKAGDWSLIHSFLRSVICDGDQESYQYFIRYIAHALQRPWEKPGILIILLGGQGTGKGTLGRILRCIWNATFLQVHNIDAITGSFNAALERAFIVFMDEALFVGDRRASDALKSLVTEPVIHINEKHQPARQTNSYHRFFAATNADHLKNTERDDRRDFALRISETRKGDYAYWQQLNREIDNGGVEAMVYDLLAMDLSGFNVRDKPDTEELLEQKLQSLGPIPRWWYDCLSSGSVSGGSEWPPFVSTADAIEGIVNISGGKLFRKPAAIDVVKALKKLCPSANKKQEQIDHVRQRGLSLPDLQQARTEFEQYIGGTVEWQP